MGEVESVGQSGRKARKRFFFFAKHAKRSSGGINHWFIPTHSMQRNKKERARNKPVQNRKDEPPSLPKSQRPPNKIIKPQRNYHSSPSPPST